MTIKADQLDPCVVARNEWEVADANFKNANKDREAADEAAAEAAAAAELAAQLEAQAAADAAKAYADWITCRTG